MTDFIIVYSKALFALNFFIAGIWLTAIIWFKAARLYEKVTRGNHYR